MPDLQVDVSNPDALRGSIIDKFTWHGQDSGWITAAILKHIVSEVCIIVVNAPVDLTLLQNAVLHPRDRGASGRTEVIGDNEGTAALGQPQQSFGQRSPARAHGSQY
jgi:hypothetical protein